MLALLKANAESIQAVAALFSAFALIPAAIIFLINQGDERTQRKDRRYKELDELYKEFLKLGMAYPRLRVTQYTPPASIASLSADELLQRDTLFEMLTSMLERAFLSYEFRKESYRREQWSGWAAYAADYCSREDYLEWWLRVVGQNDWDRAFSPGASQYDRRFERFVTELLRSGLALQSASETGGGAGGHAPGHIGSS